MDDNWLKWVMDREREKASVVRSVNQNIKKTKRINKTQNRHSNMLAFFSVF